MTFWIRKLIKIQAIWSESVKIKITRKRKLPDTVYSRKFNDIVNTSNTNRLEGSQNIQDISQEKIVFR